jgi:hypothetical protein
MSHPPEHQLAQEQPSPHSSTLRRWAPVFTVSLIALLLWSSYRQIAKVLKWFTLTLFAYDVLHHRDDRGDAASERADQHFERT